MEIIWGIEWMSIIFSSRAPASPVFLVQNAAQTLIHMQEKKTMDEGLLSRCRASCPISHSKTKQSHVICDVSTVYRMSTIFSVSWNRTKCIFLMVQIVFIPSMFQVCWQRLGSSEWSRISQVLKFRMFYSPFCQLLSWAPTSDAVATPKINQMRIAPRYCQWKCLIYKSYQRLAELKNQNSKPFIIKEPKTILKKERAWW